LNSATSECDELIGTLQLTALPVQVPAPEVQVTEVVPLPSVTVTSGSSEAKKLASAEVQV
jgi:hypothetical protein